MCMGVHMFFGIDVFILLAVCLEVRHVCLVTDLLLVLAHTICYHSCANLHLHQQCIRVVFIPYSCQNLLIFYLVKKVLTWEFSSRNFGSVIEQKRGSVSSNSCLAQIP